MTKKEPSQQPQKSQQVRQPRQTQRKRIYFLRAEVIAACVNAGFITRILYLLLLLSFPILGDIYISFIIGNKVGIFLVLAIEASISLVGLFFIRNNLFCIAEVLTGSIGIGKIPEKTFAYFFGNIFAALFIIIPGFVSDALGILLLVPGINLLFHYGFIHIYKQEIIKATEYLASQHPQQY